MASHLGAEFSAPFFFAMLNFIARVVTLPAALAHWFFPRKPLAHAIGYMLSWLIGFFAFVFTMETIIFPAAAVLFR